MSLFAGRPRKRSVLEELQQVRLRELGFDDSDQTFNVFRAKLADELTWFINKGGRIGRGHGCKCPLGVLVGDNPLTPYHARRARDWTMATPEGAMTKFMNGWLGDVVGSGPYYALGCVYRRRFYGG